MSEEEQKNRAIEKVESIVREKELKRREKKKRKQQKYYEKMQQQNEQEKQELRKQIANESSEVVAINNNDKKFRGLVSAIIVLSILTVILASFLTYFLLSPSKTDNAVNSAYSKCFYDTVSQVKNIDVNLSKIINTSDTTANQKYLLDTAVNSELCENNLQSLPINDESKFYTTKLINQIGDYSKYLSNKLANGEQFSSVDYDNLSMLYNANKTLKNKLNETVEKIGSGYNFVDLINSSDGIIIDNFNELQNISSSYPELIYDGPFSDGLENRKIKWLSGEKITGEKAKENFSTIFSYFNPQDIKVIGESNSTFDCYNIEANVDNDILFASFSKTGGKLVMFSYSGSCKAQNIDTETAINNAQSFLEKLGIENMQAVWSNFTGNVHTINFAYTIDNVIIYSDLIKIRVCAETGKIIGMEATSYYTNHTDRSLSTPTLTEEMAQEKVSKNIEVLTSRLCVVPIGNESEKLCYEFMCANDDTVYYVYIDAENGKQVEMFRVIEGTEGRMLI